MKEGKPNEESFKCRWCGEDFMSKRGLFCPHCSRFQKTTMKETTEDTIGRIREQFVSELETLYTEESFVASVDELAKLEKLKQGEKVSADRILVDKLARIANELRLVREIEDLHKIYDYFLIGWGDTIEGFNK